MTEIRPLPQAPALTDEVTTRLRNAIVDGTFRPGEQILQAEVARALQVSRGPVREALRSLISEGLVIDEPRRGTFVLDPGPQDVREIFDLRVALETRAAQLVMQGQSPGTFAEMEETLEVMAEACHAGDPLAISEADFAFHVALCRGSENQRLMRLYAQQSAPLRQLMRIENRYVHTRGDGPLDEHRGLLDLLKTGDAVLFGERLCAHIETARDRLLTMLDARDEPPAANRKRRRDEAAITTPHWEGTKR